MRSSQAIPMGGNMIKAQINSIRFFFNLLLTGILIAGLTSIANSQALSAGTVTGAVVDPNNAVVPNAQVTISNAITGYKRTVTTDTDGIFRFNDVPPNNYQIAVSAAGFQPASESLTVRTSVPINVKLSLALGTA